MFFNILKRDTSGQLGAFFVMFTPALFLVPLLVSAVFLALAVYGLLKPNESRMTCRLIGLG